MKFCGALQDFIWGGVTTGVDSQQSSSDNRTGESFPPASEMTVNPPKRWVFLLYDQLNLSLIPFHDEHPTETGLILIESIAKGTSRPYHKQKIAVLISNMRHFAIEAQKKGHPVSYIVTKEDYSDTLQNLGGLGTIHTIRAAEKSTRDELSPLIDSGLLLSIPTMDGLRPSIGSQMPWNKPPSEWHPSIKNSGRKLAY